MDLAALPGFPTNLKPILPGHPRHKSHRNGKSASARKRRKRARAKYAAAIVRKHGEEMRAMPEARRRANIEARQKRRVRIEQQRERRVRIRGEVAAFESGKLRPIFE